VLQFARVAQATGFVYVFPLIDANRRREFVPTTPLPPGILPPVPDRAAQDLHSFFPFDPYKLPKSASYIEPVYREWSAVAIDGDEEEDEDEEEDVEKEGYVYDAGRAEPERVADGLGASFGGMSISPAPAVPLAMAMRDVSVAVG
jgi:RNA polymerase I-specific transcription initiation factor RRN3